MHINLNECENEQQKYINERLTKQENFDVTYMCPQGHVEIAFISFFDGKMYINGMRPAYSDNDSEACSILAVENGISNKELIQRAVIKAERYVVAKENTWEEHMANLPSPEVEMELFIDEQGNAELELFEKEIE